MKTREFAHLFGGLFSALTLLSFLFKLLHYQGAQILLIISMGALTFIFIPLIAFYKYHKNKSK